jgi:GAF domain-containing protein/PAS domain-containing protein
MSILTLPYVLVYIAAFAISIVVFIYAWRNKNAPGVQAFAIAVLLEISWLVGYIFEINSSSMEAKIFWDNFQFIGSFYAPIALLIFSLGFVGRKFNARRLTIILGILPTLLLLIILLGINPELVRINPQVIPGVPYDELTYEYGPVTTIGNYYLYAILLAYLVVLLTGFTRKEKNFRAQLWLVIIGMVLPIVGLIIGQFLGIKFANQRDTSPLLFAVSNAIIIYGVLRFRLFNIIPLARDALFETINDVLIILNNKDVIVDANGPARQLLSAAGPNPIGVHIGSIFPELFEQFGDVTEIRTEIDSGDGSIYDLKITPLHDSSNQFIGRLINAHDITQQKKVEMETQATSKQNQRRAAQFQAIANVASATTTLQNQEETLTQVVQTISKQLGHYHVGVFLIDESKKYAILKAANSEGGQRMLERGHRLEVGETGIVGFVAVSGRPRIALDTGTDAVYFNNPDLPETRSEVALPLVQGREIIGVLDVQSTTPNAFTPDDIDTLSILASQVSVTIQNTRLYEENIIALQNAEKAYRQLSGETWREALKTQTVKGYVYDGIRSEPLKQRSQLEHSVSIPVTVRGQNIGALKLQALNSDRKWSEDELAMITAAAERAALALESARLLAESQKRAAKEHAIGEIAAKISAQSEVDDLLKTAVKELSRTLPGTEIAIQFRKEEAE